MPANKTSQNKQKDIVIKFNLSGLHLLLSAGVPSVYKEYGQKI